MTDEEGARDASAIQGASDQRKRPGPGSDLVALAVLTVIAFVIGSLVNVFRAEPLPWKYQSREQSMDAAIARLQATSPPPAGADESSEPTHEIRLEEFQPFVTEHRGPVIDARPAVFYHEAHVPGALSLPRETFEQDYPGLRGQLEKDKDKPIAVYCSGADCPDSQLVTEALTKLGYRRLVIYTSGWDEWSQTGLPQEGVAATR